jgi:UDP-N-acetyl-D-glucosamine dehydrogenase
LPEIKKVAAVLICVPTPLKKNRAPDLSFVLNTGKSIAPHLQRGQLVVLESTTYPGTTENELRAVLEKGSGLKAGKDFHLAFSPEREDPGNPQSRVADIPKVIGGYTPACLAAAQKVYGRAIRNAGARRQLPHRRGGEAAGKCFSRRQHRARQRTQGRLCRAGH